MQRLEKRIPLATPTMHGDEMDYVREAFDRNWIAPLGFNVDAFEMEIQEYLNANGQSTHALVLSSGTAAIHMAVKLAGVRRGDVVLCSDMTFAATVNPVSYEGGRQVFIDSEYDTWNMSPEALEKAFEKYPEARVVVLAHLYGTPARLDEIMKICARYGAVLIEDAAESFTATYKGRQTGTFGDYGILSFNGNKLITTSGGGMLLTKDVETREKAFYWSTQAREKVAWYQHEEVGYNYRISNVLAGIGRGQLKYADAHREKKKEIYCRYMEGFKGLPVTMNPYIQGDMQPNFWLSCMLLDRGVNVKPLEIYEKLNALNIESRPIWKPMHLQPLFRNNDFVFVGDKAVNEDIFERGLCLPSDIKMTADEQDTVIEAIREIIR